jgi:phasin
MRCIVNNRVTGRRIVADPTIDNLMPPEMRAFAEQGVQNAQKAFDQLMSATQRAVSAFEGQATSAQWNMRGLHQKVLGFSERNVAASFDFARKLLQARDGEEIVRLHAEFVKAQIETMTGQAKELTQQATSAASKPQGRA